MFEDRLKFGTIVIATDLGATASSALRYGQAIARLHGSTLIIVHVIDPVAYAFPTGASEALIAQQAAREELRKFEEEVREEGIQVHSVVESGVICDRIVQAVQDHHADLLILGTRAKTEAGQVALGTVARQLLSRTPCPLLAVSPTADEHMPWAGRWRRVVVATDFSTASLTALGCAHRIAHENLLVLHVPFKDIPEQHSLLIEKLRFLAPFNESHTVPVEHFVVSGDPGETIAEYARKHHADLVVLGAPSNELTPEHFYTSTVLEVISHAPCPVLCVPAAGHVSFMEVFKEVACKC
jgi:nucleotide-binding universal stress UspA family protein